MKFTKIKYDGTTVSLEYENDVLSTNGKKTATIEAKFKSNEKPVKEFIDAFKDLAIEAEYMLKDVLKEGSCSNAEVRGVSLSWSSKIMGAVITLLIPTTSANSPVVINTPHLPESDYNPNGDGPTLTSIAAEKIRTLIAEAEEYFNGKREKEIGMFDSL